MNPFKITAEQQKEFAEKGYLRLPNAVPSDLLATWQNLLSNLNEDTLKAYKTGTSSANACIIEGPDQPVMTRFNTLIEVYPTQVLDLMACPAMLAIASELCGKDAVPLQCDALFKHPGQESTVLWHQDAIHPRNFPYLNIGIYLDDAPLGDGCLEYVATSQHETQDMCKLVQDYGWNIPGKESMPVKAGDILIQDMMVLHGSQMKKNVGVRRTIYVEMRPAAGLREHGINSEEWIRLRERWMGLVLRRTVLDFTSETFCQFPIDLKSDDEEFEQILSIQESPMPANYCHQTANVHGYPF